MPPVRPLVVMLCAALLGGCGSPERHAARTVVHAPPPPAAPPPAAAHAPWSRPASTGPVANQLYSLRLATGARGAGLLAVQAFHGGGYSCVHGDEERTAIAARTASGRLGPLRVASAKVRSGPLLLPDGRAVAVVARAARGSVECAPVEHLEVATLDRAGRIVGAVPLAARVSADDVTLARGRRGNLAVAWIEVTEAPDVGDLFRLRVALGRPGQRLRPALSLAEAPGVEPQDPGIGAVAVAAEPDGGFLVAYASEGHVRAVTLAPDGRHGEPRVIGPTDSITTLAAAESASGRAALAWSAQDGGEERNAPLRVYAALRPAGGATFAPAHLLDRGDAFDDPHGAFALAVALDGRVLLGWDNVAGGWRDRRYPVRVAEARPRGSFGRVVELDRSGWMADVALAADGRALVVWSRDGQLLAARHGAGATGFGRAGVVSDREQAYEAVARFSAGRPLVAWIASPRGSRPIVRVAHGR